MILCLFVVSCGEKVNFNQAPTIEQNLNKNTPLAAILKYSADKPISITAKLESDGHSFTIDFDKTSDTKNGLPVVGMKPGRTYKIFLKIHTEKSSFEYKEQFEFSTPDLPNDPYKILRFKVKREKALPMEPGITLLNPRLIAKGHDGSKFGMLAAVDSLGEIIWYYRCNARISDFNFLPNRHISYLTADHRLVEIDLLGNIVKSWFASERPDGPVENSIPIKSLTFHHDATLLQNGNYLILGSDYKEIDNYYTSETDINAKRKRQKVMGDILLEFTPEGEVVWEWNVFDHLDPMRIGYETFSKYWFSRGYPGVLDWSHANTVLYDSTDNTAVVNFRLLSSLTKINKDGSIKWIFGEPTGLSKELLSKSLKLKNGDWFWHQHSASFTTHSTILIYNNNLRRAWPFQGKDESGFSHAVEFKINEEEMTAEQIWTSEMPNLPGVRSVAMGDVDFLDKTGNVLVSYGLVAANKEYGRERPWSMVREFTRDSPTDLVWELQLWPLENYEDSISWVLFSSERINNFY